MTEPSGTPLGAAGSFGDLPSRIVIGSRTFFLIRDNSGFHLLSNVCPHQGGAVEDQGMRFECPLHGWRFDRESGRCLNAPSRRLTAYPVVVHDGVLYADVPAEPHVDPVRRGGRATKLGLTIQLHAHACLEIAYENFVLLTDPWLDGPAFLGAWAPYPPHEVSGTDLRPDAILITHEHSDHFHEPTLRLFDRQTPIYVPDFPNQRMAKRLAALGFVDVRPVRFGDTVDIADGSWRITAYEPESYWNDAVLLIDIDGFRILDINDAGVNARIARMVSPVDVVAVQFSAGASGYPWTWTHLTDEQKIAISAQACSGKLQLIREAARLYGAAAVLPFASHFTLWHPTHRAYARMMRRNSLADVRTTLAGEDVDVIDLLPGDAWDVGRGVIRRGSADPDALSGSGPTMTAEDVEVDAATFARAHPSDESLSRQELVEYLLRLNDVPEMASCEDVIARIRGTASAPDGASIDVSFAIVKGRLTILPSPSDRPNLIITTSRAILTTVVREELSWDEAFIGYWCQFERHPNVYHAGFWRLLQAPYFKRPADMATSTGLAINPASTVAEVLEAHGAPADRILRRYGLYCAGCQHSTADSIEMAARQHGLESRRVEHLLKELNSAFASTVDRTVNQQS
jgi:CMP-N-acetylneuraminate monooxygenase